MPLIRKTPGPVPTAPGDLDAADPGQRWAAARRLVSPEDVGTLGRALATETDPRVREAILTSLARIGDTASAQAVMPLIRSDDAAVRTAALDSLRAMPAAMASSLPELLRDPDADVRLLACELVRALPSPAATLLLCDLVAIDPEVNVCAAALEVLTEVGGAEMRPRLEACVARFADQPFLAFALKVALDRIGAAGSPSVG